MLRVFLDVVLPVAIVAALGGAVGRWRAIPVAPVSALVFYLFSPALVFRSLADSALTLDVSLRIVAVMAGTFVAMYGVSALWSTFARHDAPLRAGFALAATTPNVGNMGLPVAQLAFGQAGLEIAVMNFVVGATLANSAGIAIASLAGGSPRAALVAPLRAPALWAAVAGVIVNVAGVSLPVAIDAPMRTLAGAAVPTMLAVLGLQLQQSIGMDRLLDTGVLNVARLLVAPAVAWGVASGTGLGGDARGTLVVLAAMPTAVITTIIATQFGAAPAFVTRAVVSSTLLCMLTLTPLITLVR
ncbi:MAG: AEC family transporter [Dehalococcoidia bacterium]|nr:AEC family transporter [Dehalococcoidia bacterium]